jgi:hypothetical protein
MPATLTLQAHATVPDLTADLVMVGVVDDDATADAAAMMADLDVTLTGGALSQVREEHAKALSKAGALSPTIRVGGAAKASRFVLVGLGDDSVTARGGVLGKAMAAACTSENNIASLQVVLPASLFAQDAFVTGLVAVFYASFYRGNNRYRRGPKPVAEALAHVTLLSPGAMSRNSDAAVASGRALATGLLLAKDIVNAPHNVLNSESLADVAVGNPPVVAVGNPPSAPRQVHFVFQQRAWKGFGRGRRSVANGYETLLERNPCFWGVCYGDLSLAVIEAATSFMRAGGRFRFHGSNGDLSSDMVLDKKGTVFKQLLQAARARLCRRRKHAKEHGILEGGDITSKSVATPVSQGTPGWHLHSSLLLSRDAIDPASTFHPGGAPCRFYGTGFRVVRRVVFRISTHNTGGETYPAPSRQEYCRATTTTKDSHMFHPNLVAQSVQDKAEQCYYSERVAMQGQYLCNLEADQDVFPGNTDTASPNDEDNHDHDNTRRKRVPPDALSCSLPPTREKKANPPKKKTRPTKKRKMVNPRKKKKEVNTILKYAVPRPPRRDAVVLRPRARPSAQVPQITGEKASDGDILPFMASWERSPNTIVLRGRPRNQEVEAAPEPKDNVITTYMKTLLRRTAPPPPKRKRTAPPPKRKRTAPPPKRKRTAPPPPKRKRTTPPPQRKRTAPPKRNRGAAPGTPGTPESDVYKKDKKRETAPSAAQKCLLNEEKTGTRYWDIHTGAQWGAASYPSKRQVKNLNLLVVHLMKHRIRLGITAPRDGWEKWCAFRRGDERYLPEGLSKTMHATAKRFLFLQRLVVAMILSCRTSDGAVDKCTQILREHGLFSAAALACLSTDEIWGHIRSCGFETAKPRFIKAACQNMIKLGYLPQNGDKLFRWLGWG